MRKSMMLLAGAAVCSMLLGGCGGGSNPASPAAGNDGKKLIVYTSMKENLIKGIVNGFKKKYPDIQVDYQSAGAGKLMAKIAAEKQSGKILADVIWTSEVPDFYSMKKQGMLEPYKTPILKELVNPFEDYDGSFTAARLGTLGIVINTDKVKNPPKAWNDLLKPEYKRAFGMANPALSGTSYMSIAILEKKFGWKFFEQLKANGARVGKGSGEVIDDTSSGELSASLGVDYITNGKIKKGAHLDMCYPPELIVVPSPVAIFKDTAKVDAAKKFVDYLLSAEAQTMVANEGTIPVRADVQMPAKFHLPAPQDALKKAIKINFAEAVSTKEATIKKFAEIMQTKK